MSNRILKIVLCSILFFVLAPAFLSAQDKIIAVVNNAAITQKELDDFLTFMRLQLSGEKDYSSQELENNLQSLKQDLLNKLIEDKLILQEARRSNVTIEDSLIKARMMQIKKRYRDDEEFQRSLAAQGLTEADIEEKIRDQAAMYRVIEQEVKSTVSVSPSEVTDFYSANIDEFRFPQERSLEYLKVKDENVAREIDGRVKKGQDLALVAKELGLTLNSLSVSSKEELKPKLKEVVLKLNKGETSEPILIDDYYYILKLLEIIPARQQNLSEVQDAIHKFLFEEKMQKKLTSWLEGLKKNSYINIIGN